MSKTEFYLSGLPSGRHIGLDVSTYVSLDDLKEDVAHLLSVARADSLSFHGEDGQLECMPKVKGYRGSVGVKVDGKAVDKPRTPPEIPSVGNYLDIFPDHVGNYARLLGRYGSVVRTVSMGTVVYVTNDPRVSEIVLGETFFTKTTSDTNHPLYHMNDQTALFTCDTASPAFKVAHKFVPPSLSPRAVRHHVPAMEKAIADCFGVLDELDQRQQAFHAYQYMFKVGGQVVYKVVLGLDVGHFKTVDTPPHEIIRLMGQYLALQKQASLSPQWHRHLPFGRRRELQQVHDRLWGLVDEAVAGCEPGGGDAPMEQAALEATCIADYLRRALDDRGDKLPHDYLLSNVVALVGAGLATTASTLSWLMYAVVHYPGNQERLLQELVDAGAGPDTNWTYEQIHALPFLECFLKEALRLHGPSFQTARSARQDVVVPGGWMIPEGAVTLVSVPNVHRHADHWDNPQRFDPDRWLGTDSSGKKRHRMAFTPFAAGPRGCIGLNMAQLEAKLTLAKLVYRYRLVDASKDPVIYDPEFLVLRPTNLYIRAVKRKSWPAKTKVQT